MYQEKPLVILGSSACRLKKWQQIELDCMALHFNNNPEQILNSNINYYICLAIPTINQYHQNIKQLITSPNSPIDRILVRDHFLTYYPKLKTDPKFNSLENLYPQSPHFRTKQLDTFTMAITWGLHLGYTQFWLWDCSLNEQHPSYKNLLTYIDKINPQLPQSHRITIKHHNVQTIKEQLRLGFQLFCLDHKLEYNLKSHYIKLSRPLNTSYGVTAWSQYDLSPNHTYRFTINWRADFPSTSPASISLVLLDLESKQQRIIIQRNNTSPDYLNLWRTSVSEPIEISEPAKIGLLLDGGFGSIYINKLQYKIIEE